MTLLDRIVARAEKRYKKRVIGDSRTDVFLPLLTRYFILKDKWFGGLYLHLFHRSDMDREFHDHPWHFASAVLAGGYWEVTPKGRKWRGAGSICIRRATHQHRVELEDGTRCLTLIWVSKDVRPWGFHTDQGWVQWDKFINKRDRDTVGYD